MADKVAADRSPDASSSRRRVLLVVIVLLVAVLFVLALLVLTGIIAEPESLIEGVVRALSGA